jgi:diguanylate cyclase (GGDEF)-like protein/PAS domain S-box-containing protein
MNKSSRLKVNILSMFILGVVAILLALLYYNYTKNQHSIQKHIDNYRHDSNLIFKYTVEEYISRYKAHIEHSFATDDIKNAIKNRDKEALLKATKEKYEILNNIYNMKHNMHFHTNKSISLLRLHQEDKSGDDLKIFRPIISSTNRLVRDQHALEVGKYGIYYRIVSTVIDDFKHIGSVEIGIDPISFIQKIEKYLNASSMLIVKTDELKPLVDKSLVDSKFGEYSLVYKNRFCPDVRDKIDLNNPISRIEHKGKDYLINSELNLKDYNGKVVAKVILAYDITDFIQKSNTLILNTTLMILLISILIVIFVNFLLDVLIKDTKEYQETLIDEKYRLKAIIDSIDDIIFFKDRDLNYKIVNKAFEKATNSSSKDIIGKNDNDIFDKDSIECFSKLDEETLFNASYNTNYSQLKSHITGNNTHILTSKSPLRDKNGNIIGIVGITKDISAYKMIEQNLTSATDELKDSKVALEQKVFEQTKELKSSENRLLSANKELLSQLKIIDKYVIMVTTNRLGEVLDISKSYIELTKYPKNIILQEGLKILRDPTFDSEIYKELWRTIKNGNIWEGDIRNIDANGDTYWVNMQIFPIFDSEHEIVKFQAISTDITDKKLIQELAITDELTTLYNRRYFNQKLEELISISKNSSKNLTFIMFDIDHFKLYNDNYGHQLGDTTLSLVALKFKEITQSLGLPFRLGGEEFGFLSTSLSENEAYSLASKLKEEVQNLNIEHKYNTPYETITVSIGLYCTKSHKELISQNIYKSCDELLYKAKRVGRNSVCSNVV